MKHFLILPLCLLFSSTSLATETFPPIPGQRYDIGGYKIHLHCEGKGSPTVLIDTGLGDDSSDWQAVQSSAAKQTRVCVYDRAGYGWSDVGPMPRNSVHIAHELEKLLEVAELDEPLVLVGHSFGGYNIRVFAANHPEKVVGMVFVDASHENQYEQLNIRLPRYTDHQPNVLIMPKVTQSGISNKSTALRERAIHAARSEITALFQSALQVKRLHNIPQVPTIVITRGKQAWYGNDNAVKKEKIWIQLQQDLWRLSPISQHIFAHRSGHDIHLDQPELVAKAISDVVTNSRIIMN